MENSKIHEGLEKSSVRDLIADGMRVCSQDIIKLNNERDKTFTKKGIELSIEHCEHQIDWNRRKLKLLKISKAYELIMEKEKWDYFDVSNETKKDGENKLWLNFIGTEEEYGALLSRIENEGK